MRKELLFHLLNKKNTEYSWKQMKIYLPQYKNNQSQKQQASDDASNQYPQWDWNSSAL